MSTSSNRTSDQKSIGDDTITNPESYWSMSVYALAVQTVLMMLRDLYQPAEALRWITSPQPLLDGKVPADMLVTIDERRKVEALIVRICDGAFS